MPSETGQESRGTKASIPISTNRIAATATPLHPLLNPLHPLLKPLCGASMLQTRLWEGVRADKILSDRDRVV